MSKDITIFVCGNSISSAHRNEYGELPDSTDRKLHEADVVFDVCATNGQVRIEVSKNRYRNGFIIDHQERTT
jgi:hypothetical protein